MFELDIFDGHLTLVAVDRPTVTLDTVDTVGVGDRSVNIHHEDGVVGIDVYLVGLVRGRGEGIALCTGDVIDTILLLEIDLVAVGMRSVAVRDRNHLSRFR